MKTYSKGFVQKDRGYWRAVISWQEDGKQHKMRRSTKVRCYPDKRDPDGKILKSDNRGKSAAEEILRRWRDELIAAQSAAESEPVTCDATLYDYAKGYFDLLHVKESTKSGYKAALSHLLGTDAGKTKIGDLTATDLYRWEQAMYEDGLKENTVAHYHAFVAQVLKHAVAEGDIPRSPAVPMRAPRRRPKPVNALTESATTHILERIASMGTSPLAVASTIALTTGMRRAEVCALRWLDVDLDHRTIHVIHALTKGHGFSLDTPKDPAGGDATRDIEIGLGLTELLKRRKEAMREEVASLGAGWDDSLFVIGNAAGAFKNPEVLGREWSTMVQLEGWRGTQGEPLRFHDLRHAFATLAIADGMDVMVLARVLGHRDASTTLNVYATALTDAKRAGMERMDSLMLGKDRQAPRGKHFRIPA